MFEKIRSNWAAIVVNLATFVFVTVIAFQIGGWLERPRIEEAQAQTGALGEELAATRLAHHAQVDRLRGRLSAQRRRIDLLEARRHLAIALDQLDQRNFGVSEHEWRLAAGILGRVEEPEAVRDLHAQLDGFTLGEGGSFDQGREQLREMARGIDSFMQPAVAVAPNVEAPTPASSGSEGP